MFVLIKTQCAACYRKQTGRFQPWHRSWGVVRLTNRYLKAKTFSLKVHQLFHIKSRRRRIRLWRGRRSLHAQKGSSRLQRKKDGDVAGMSGTMRRTGALQRLHVAQEEQPLCKRLLPLLRSQWKDKRLSCFWSEGMSIGITQQWLTLMSKGWVRIIQFGDIVKGLHKP